VGLINQTPTTNQASTLTKQCGFDKSNPYIFFSSKGGFDKSNTYNESSPYNNKTI